MILGLISFLLFVGEQSTVFQKLLQDKDGSILHLLHFVHMALFVTVLFYITLAISLFVISNIDQHYWKDIEKKPLGKIFFNPSISKSNLYLYIYRILCKEEG